MTTIASAAERKTIDVLVVEDEQRLRSFILRALPEMGLTGIAAAGADEARALLDEHDIRVLLLDIRLGASDGLELLEARRAAGDKRPAVIMTAYANVPGVQRALRADASDYITKPFRLAELEQALSRACRKAGDAGPRLAPPDNQPTTGPPTSRSQSMRPNAAPSTPPSNRPAATNSAPPNSSASADARSITGSTASSPEGPPSNPGKSGSSCR